MKTIEFKITARLDDDGVIRGIDMEIVNCKHQAADVLVALGAAQASIVGATDSFIDSLHGDDNKARARAVVKASREIASDMSGEEARYVSTDKEPT